MLGTLILGLALGGMIFVPLATWLVDRRMDRRTASFFACIYISLSLVWVAAYA